MITKRLIIIDDFYSNVDDVRESALKLDYSFGGHYAGYSSTDKYVPDHLVQFFSELVGEKLWVRPGENACGRFRLSFDGQDVDSDIHPDRSTWAYIMYLNVPQDCKGGLDFYKHKQTGWERCPTTEEAAAVGIDMRDLLLNQTKDLSKWEKIMTVPMKYNRMVMFDGKIFHAPGQPATF